MSELQVPHGSNKLICPFHKKYMSKVCHTCPMWVHIRGQDQNTGELVDKWNCTLAFLPMLLIENAQMSRQAGAATESFRNEVMGRVKSKPIVIEQKDNKVIAIGS